MTETDSVSEEFFKMQAGRRDLSGRGYALAADAGLAVARELTCRHGTIRWQVVRRPKRDISYNLPVLVGFRHNLSLDPVGGSIAEAHGVLRGDRDEAAWQHMYEYGSRNVDASHKTIDATAKGGT
jgi:hypothetical protein